MIQTYLIGKSNSTSVFCFLKHPSLGLILVYLRSNSRHSRSNSEGHGVYQNAI